jgi:hypothetical protein
MQALLGKTPIIGIGAYWAGRAAACPPFACNGQDMLLALPLFVPKK